MSHDLTGIAATVAALRSKLGEQGLSEGDWLDFLDEVRRYGEDVARELRELADKREQLLAIIDLIPVAFFVKDSQSRFFLMNRACQEQWGMTFADLRDTDGSQFFPPEQMTQFLATDRAIFAGRSPVEFEETFWSVATQSNRIGYTLKRPMYDAAGNPQYLVCVTIDITEWKSAEAALRDSETRFRDAIAHSPNPMMMHAEDGQIIMISEVLTAITGYRLEDLPTIQVWAEKVYATPVAGLQRSLQALYELTVVRYEGEYPIRTASGDIRIWEIQTQPLPKLPDGRRVILTLGVDITVRKRMEKELHALATTDFLTGLPNRRQFLAELEREFVRMQRFGSQATAILMLDLDHFKEVNDVYGHAAGDAVLQHFAGLMRSTLREVDTAGRLGGEEFGLILPGAGADEARITAERLREVIVNTPLVQGGTTIRVTASIGVAALDPRDKSADVALIRADEALYHAKRNGRDRVEPTHAELAMTAA